MTTPNPWNSTSGVGASMHAPAYYTTQASGSLNRPSDPPSQSPIQTVADSRYLYNTDDDESEVPVDDDPTIRIHDATRRLREEDLPTDQEGLLRALLIRQNEFNAQLLRKESDKTTLPVQLPVFHGKLNENVNT